MVKISQVRPSDTIFELPAAMMNNKAEQRAEICFCVRSGIGRGETLQRLVQIHGANALSKSQVNRWYRKFEDGHTQLTDAPRNQTPRKVNNAKVDEVRHLVTRSKNISVRQLSRETSLSIGSVHKVLRKKLGLKKRPAKWVLHHLTPAQKTRRMVLARAALQRLRQRGHPCHVICGDESWFHCWELGSRHSTCQWLAANEERPQKPRIEMSTVKTMLIIFFDCQGVVFRQWVPDGVGINTDRYLEVMTSLRDAVRRKRHAQWNNNSWTLLHDNAPAHNACPVHAFLTTHHINVLPHAGYSPDLNPPDFWLFSKLKNMVSGNIYQRVEDLQTAVDQAINQIPVADFQMAMDRLPVRLRKCIDARGGYFE